MKKTKPHLDARPLEEKLTRLYWLMRIGIASIWLWTSIASWFIYPQPESLDLLRRVGITHFTYIWFVSACLLDVAMAIGSAVMASRMLWQCQILIVVFYSIVIAIELPEYLIHPFGPITKNIAVLCCLYSLALMEKR